jgi:hypothetical protein
VLEEEGTLVRVASMHLMVHQVCRLITMQDKWNWEGSHKEWFNKWLQDYCGRFFHMQGYSQYFDDLCSRNPDLINIITRSTTFDFLGVQRSQVLDWGFLDINGPLIDTTKANVELIS